MDPSRAQRHREGRQDLITSRAALIGQLGVTQVERSRLEPDVAQAVARVCQVVRGQPATPDP